MAELQSTNITGNLCVNGVAVGGGKNFKYCCFTSSTTFTPSQDLVDGDGAINVLAVGGGGAAGSCAIRWCCGCYVCFGQFGASIAPGGGGGAFTGWEPINSTDACTVTVGAGAVANEASFEGTCTGNVVQNSTNGGTTSFGDNINVVGGGNGAVGTLCCKGGSPQGITISCATTRNAGGTFAGGAQTFQYGWCYKTWAQPQGSERNNGGSGNQTKTVFDNINQATGSTTWGIFPNDGSMANLGTGNPNYFGMGGNAPIVGGKPTCRTCLIEQTSTGFSNATASFRPPTRFYGAGAHAESIVICSSNIAGPTCAEFQGTPGNDGIVVLTWYE